jgi:hypothetical protein
LYALAEYLNEGCSDNVQAVLLKIFINERAGDLNDEFTFLKRYWLCNRKPRIENCFRHVVPDKIQT